jgi:hypothetical protein
MNDTRLRAIWLSDIHRGTRGCKADALVEFLDTHDCEYLYLVGDIIDFYRLGRVGAFFGSRLGHDVRWCRAFPFSLLAHPQYVGTVMTIWGFFLAMRFPREDWYVLPAIETVYYVVGGYLEARA